MSGRGRGKISKPKVTRKIITAFQRTSCRPVVLTHGRALRTTWRRVTRVPAPPRVSDPAGMSLTSSTQHHTCRTLPWASEGDTGLQGPTDGYSCRCSHLRMWHRGTKMIPTSAAGQRSLTTVSIRFTTSLLMAASSGQGDMKL